MVWYGRVPAETGSAGMKVSKSKKCTGNSALANAATIAGS